MRTRPSRSNVAEASAVAVTSDPVGVKEPLPGAGVPIGFSGEQVGKGVGTAVVEPVGVPAESVSTDV